MSFREEDNQKNCPSRGLGLAAAAIGVGVGAALYYFFGKRPENPPPSGSTTQDWHCETEHSFSEESGSSDNSYITLSDHTTTDSSIVEDNENFCNYNNVLSNNESESDMSVSDIETGSDTDYDSNPESDSETDFENSYISDDSDSLSSSFGSNNESQDLISSLNNMVDNALSNVMTDLMEWDITSTLDVPSFVPRPHSTVNNIITSLFSPRRRNRNDTSPASAQVFRERSKTLEQCSICFDIILQDQESMVLPCTHFFHTSCILPWLQEQQTCPNCRNAVD